MTETMLRPVPRTLDELIRGADREALAQSSESLSSASFAKVRIDGASHVVKRISYDSDWVMRATHDVGVPRVVRLWAAGVFADLPHEIDTTIVGCSYDPDSGVAEILMHDVGERLLPDAEPLTVATHALFLDHMAALHASTWDMTDTIGLTTSAQRWTILPPSLTAAEAARGMTTGVPALLAPLWARLAETAPSMHSVIAALVADPRPLVRALASTPRCLVHGDWKTGNLGTHGDGRTILLDWAFPGIDAPCADIAWYVGVNCDRLPESKEATIDRYRDALEHRGVDTGPWWDRQLALSLLGGAVQQGWSKAEQPDELAWWAAAVARGVTMLP